MKSVVVLGFDLVLSSTVTGVMDVFNMSGVTWNVVHDQPTNNQFDVKLVSVDGKPFMGVGDVAIKVHGSIDSVESPDLIMIPTVAGDPEKTLELNKAVIPWLRKHCENGVDIAASSVGVYFLAEAGLLDGKEATTHWGFADDFRKRYPAVDLRAEKLITSADNIFCAGGSTSWFDLCFLLMERYCGAEYVSETVTSAVVSSMRNSDVSYSLSRAKKYHQDDVILSVQVWLEKNFTQSINFEELAEQFNMSSRTFKRRFKAATDDTPLNYLQGLRIEQAKKLLELTSDSIERIGQAVGYEDVAFFSRLFKRISDMTPTDYRKKIHRT